MADPNRCPICGSDLPPNAPEGLCPRCLFQRGLGSDTLSLSRSGPAATIPLASGSGIVRVLALLAESTGPIPRLLLRDSDPAVDPGPIVKPGSPEMPTPTDPAARLQLLGEIARGGMGAVLKGRDGDIGRDLAVKVLLEKHRDDPDLIRRFIEEAQIAGQLQHPGVVPVYELGAFADRRPYFTMKLVKGRTLADLLDARPDPAAGQPQMLGIFLQVCQTVAYAHARGVIHRDLKPSNIMVGSFGEVQVMDWGLAKVLPRGGARDDAEAGKESSVHETIIATARRDSDSDLSHAGSVMGTPAYMAPEQARGEIDQVDERADVFAMGSILCEVLTGWPAFTGRSPVEILRKAARGDLADADARLDTSGADAELLDLARACLAAEREDRPHDSGGVASRLSEHLSGVQERLRVAELARAAESARAEEAQRTAEAAERARAAESSRAEEAQARAAVERSRRRRTVALAASLLAMMGLGGLTFTYISHERQARAAAVERLLGRATTLFDQARFQPEDPVRWRTAMAAVRQVEDDPAGIAPGARNRLARLKSEVSSGLLAAERDATLRQALLDARANHQDAGLEATDAAYEAAFRDAGLDLDALSVADAAARLRSRPPAVIVELAAFLDHWSGVRRGARKRATSWRKPLELARAADDDDYRDRLRDLLAVDDLKAQAAPLRALAEEPQTDALPAPTAVLLGVALELAGEREATVDLLRRAVARHPGDVWVNFSLAESLERLSPSPREEAVRYYTAARALRPETAHDLAHLLDKMGRGAETEAIFRDLVARRQDNAWHLACFGECLKARGRPDEASRVLDRAVTAARAAVEHEPDLALARFNLGVALDAQGKPADAEAAYRSALALRPDLAEAHNNLGDVLSYQQKPAEAEAEYRAATELQPDYALAHVNLGLALSAKGKLADAEAAYRAALKLKPDDAEAHYNLGFVLNAQGKLADAEAAYRAALELQPDLAEAHCNLGASPCRPGQAGRRRDCIPAGAVQLKPDYAEAHRTRQRPVGPGQAGRRRGRIPRGAEAPGRPHRGPPRPRQYPAPRAGRRRDRIPKGVLELKFDYAEAHCNLGIALWALGKPDGAVDAYRKALKLKPDYAEAHCNLGNALWAQGKPADAEASFRAALKHQPDLAQAHLGLGNVLRAQGMPADAVDAYHAALKHQPDLTQAHFGLGIALWAQGKSAEAVDAYHAGA